MVEVLTREEEIRRHLEYNMSLPPPATHMDVMVRICGDAVDAVNAHDLDRMIDLGETIEVVRASDDAIVHECPAWDIVKRFRLDNWLNPEWFGKEG